MYIHTIENDTQDTGPYTYCISRGDSRLQGQSATRLAGPYSSVQPARSSQDISILPGKLLHTETYTGSYNKPQNDLQARATRLTIHTMINAQCCMYDLQSLYSLVRGH